MTYENAEQETRNRIGKFLMELTLKEIFVDRFCQTDPNPSNYLFDNEKLGCLDFGAAHEFEKSFVDDYI